MLVNTLAGSAASGRRSRDINDHNLKQRDPQALTFMFGPSHPTPPAGMGRIAHRDDHLISDLRIWILSDFITCEHRVPIPLGNSYRLHHTAEVLTPLTLFRVHPLDTLIFTDIPGGSRWAPLQAS